MDEDLYKKLGLTPTGAHKNEGRIPQLPQLSNAPKWWNRRGHKLAVISVSSRQFVLRSKRCELVVKNGHSINLTLLYKIEHTVGGYTLGQIFFVTHQEFLLMFGLSGEEQAASYEGQEVKTFAVRSGRFYREGPYLNLPTPSTHLRGDPNLSVFITEDVRNCARRFLDLCH